MAITVEELQNIKPGSLVSIDGENVAFVVLKRIQSVRSIVAYEVLWKSGRIGECHLWSEDADDITIIPPNSDTEE